MGTYDFTGGIPNWVFTFVNSSNYLVKLPNTCNRSSRINGSKKQKVAETASLPGHQWDVSSPYSLMPNLQLPHFFKRS
jgi:hypothetical protein